MPQVRELRVAVVGATGIVGQTLLKILENSDFLIKDIHCIASHRSKGQIIHFRNEVYEVQDLEEFDFNQVDLVFGCVGSQTSKTFIPKLPKHVILIDEASFLRLDTDIPLVIPEINSNKIKEYTKKNIIASPNCCTVPIVMVIHVLKQLAKIKRIVVSTYQSCSGAGKAAIDELLNNTNGALLGKSFMNCNKLQSNNALMRDISFNVLPQVGKFDYYEGHNNDTDEEVKIRDEINKILEETIDISVTAVRVPVLVGHSFSCNIEFESSIDLEKTIDILKNSKGINYQENYLTPKELIGPIIFNPNDKYQNLIHVSRVRHSVSGNKTILDLWIVANNLTKGAALNLFQIAEDLLPTLSQKN